MTHCLLILACVSMTEFFIRLNFLPSLVSMLSVTKKIIYLITRDSVRDHLKEKVLLKYSQRLLGRSVNILFVFSLVFSLFLLVHFFVDDFFLLIFSPFGFIESIVIVIAYSRLRKNLLR